MDAFNEQVQDRIYPSSLGWWTIELGYRNNSLAVAGTIIGGLLEHPCWDYAYEARIYAFHTKAEHVVCVAVWACRYTSVGVLHGSELVRGGG